MTKLSDLLDDPSLSKIMLEDVRKISSNDIKPLMDLISEYIICDQRRTHPEIATLKAACSIILSCVLQQRVYFALTAKSLQDLIRRDPNFIGENIPFHNRKWKQVKMLLIEKYKVIKQIDPGTHKNASMYKIIHPETLKYLETIVDLKAQYDSTKLYVNTKKE